MAKEIAHSVVQSQIGSGQWSSSSQVTEIFPIYISGIESASYWECKVETDGKPTGYVLVTANKADVLVPELSKEGLTLSEQYFQKTGTRDLVVHRYDWFHRAAFSSTENGLYKKSNGRVIEKIGFEGNFESNGLLKSSSNPAGAIDFDDFESKYYSSAQQSGCFPRYSKDHVEKYYEELTAGENSGSNLAKAAADWQDKTAELKNWCSTPTGSPWHTAQWSQFVKDDGYYIGCGAVAWAIVFAYWDSFLGTSNLFGTTNAYNYSYYGGERASGIKPAITSIAEHIGTFNVSDNSGMTWPSKMEDAVKYLTGCGYTGSWVSKLNGSEYYKFDWAKRALDNNRPCILLICADGRGIVNHYVVIEKARKTQTKYFRAWHDRNVYYTVNCGWGSTRKEICVRDWGANQNDVYPSSSLYDAYVQ